MNAHSPTTAFARDEELFQASRAKMTDTELLTFASKLSGMSTFALGKDFMRHGRSGRMVTMADYVRYQLWDTDRHGADGALRFVGADSHWPIVDACNGRAWYDVAEDKLVMEMMLAADGLPTPKTIGVVDLTARIHPGIPKIDTPEKLKDIVTQHAPGSLFIKTLGGLIGQGAMVIEDADATTIKATGNEPMDYRSFIDNVLGNYRYVVQLRLDNHEALQPYCTGLTTIRFSNFVDGDRIFSPFVAMKLTSGGNVACAFWRNGNFACGVNQETGIVECIGSRSGPTVEYIDDHPDAPGLMGLQLPFWEQARELNDRAARLFAPIGYQSTDIALTPDGPVLVELNYGGSFDIVQNSTGHGLLTDEVAAWIKARGVDLSKPTKRKKTLGIF